MREIGRFLKRRDVRIMFLLVCFIFVSTSLNAQVADLAKSLQDEGKGWVIWCIRIVAGMMTIGGLLALINGFNSNEEGYGKAARVGGGILLMASGTYCLMSAETLYSTLHLDKMFTTT